MTGPNIAQARRLYDRHAPTYDRQLKPLRRIQEGIRADAVKRLNIEADIPQGADAVLFFCFFFFFFFFTHDLLQHQLRSTMSSTRCDPLVGSSPRADAVRPDGSHRSSFRSSWSCAGT
jgi:hypothetical protein